MIDTTPLIELAGTELALYIAGVQDFIDRLDSPDGLKKTSLRSKPPDTYIRNMLCVGVLSRLMRTEFLKATRRVIVLPDCLKNYGEEACCKAEFPDGTSTCTQCNSECIVFESVERFVNGNTSLVLEPEDMNKYFADLRAEYGTVGIVGVACALTMLSGFEKTLRHKHPTQGVFLNYSSCAHHWADPAYNTSYSLKRMAWVLNKCNSSIRNDLQRRGETYSMEKPLLSPDDFYRRLDALADSFERDYLPRFRAAFPDADVYDLSREIQKIIVPDLITRDSA